MQDAEIRQERAQNLWNSTARKFPPLSRAVTLDPAPDVGPEQIGGLAAAQEEVLTYACAATSPDIYASWGTFPPSGLLLLGQAGCGKTLLAQGLASRATTGFLDVRVPVLALEVLHQGGKVGELLEAWSQVLEELPPTTVYFHELEFLQAEDFGGRRSDVPVGPMLDFLVDLTDRATAASDTLLVASTSYPDSLRPAFVKPGRFERIVEVTPIFPDDVVAAIRIHAASAEKRAGRRLFETVDWQDVVSRFRGPSIGEWIHLMHGVLRRKARCEAASEGVALVSTEDLLAEVDRFRLTMKRLPRPVPAGTYL